MKYKPRWHPVLCKKCDDYILTREEAMRLGGDFFHYTCPSGGTLEDLMRKMIGGRE